jgi:hypothetical protein
MPDGLKHLFPIDRIKEPVRPVTLTRRRPFHSSRDFEARKENAGLTGANSEVTKQL